MKKLLLLLITTFTLSCCNKDDNPQPVSEIDKLPKATQTGANTAGCLVDGVAFLPNNQSLQPLVCNYLDGQDFSLGISNKINGIYYKIYLNIGNTNLQVGETYQLTTEQNEKFGEYYFQHPLPNLYELHYKTNSTIIGELKITHHDYNQAILSGTFWFDSKFNYAYNYNGNINEDEIIKVRNGRFDMHY